MGAINYNIATNTNFKAEISGAPQFNYFVQSVSLPSINMSGVDTPFRNYSGVMTSNRVDYDPLTFTYVLSEDFENYLFLHNWMIEIRDNDSLSKQFRDITLHILNNNKLTNLTVVFYNCFPVSLADINLESAVTDTDPLTTTATFRYQYFDIKRKNEN
jgi:hypothetical protein